jgi:ATPase family associated with various cellular activities (AAA)
MTASTDWLEVNRTALQDALARVKTRLQQHAERRADSPAVGPDGGEIAPESALGLLEQIFLLTPFETDVLVLCAGVELDASVAQLCAAAAGDPTRTDPTFSLALAAFDHAHWSALAPDAPLRRWRLVEPVPAAGPATLLTRAPLRLDERLLHFLVGLDAPDVALTGRLTPVARPAAPLPARHERLAQRLAELWSGPAPRVALVGDADSGRDVAARSAELLGCVAREIDATQLPMDPGDRRELLTLVNRDGLLGGGPLIVTTSADTPAAWLDELSGSVVVLASGPLPRLVTLEVGALDPDEQASVWDSALGDGGDGPHLAEQYSLSAAAIRSAASDAALTGESPWATARTRARQGLDALAARIETRAGWDDLVLPAATEVLLREIEATVRHRRTVYRTWGMDPGSSLRGTGVSALFAGPSGTGKTLAAEVIAGELDLDLYRIDLSQIVSKYIGETEKNLRSVFDAADAGGCVLLFDEADALFGKRSEVKDSHDRYANLEVSYLLQRMEAYRGLAILTTNLKDNIDKAFLRRLSAIVSFPFPDVAERERIWRRVLVADLPTQDVRIDRLARLAVPGGVIRNIALGAAFRAADDGTAVGMPALLAAARRECAKLERPLTPAEVGDWL